MIFPSDAEIREYSAYYIRAVKIFRETFKFTMGREPTETELQDFSRMGIIPFGILKQQNGNSNFQIPQISPQKLAQQSEQEQKLKTEQIMDILKDHPELRIEGDKIVVRQFIKTETFNKIRDALKHKGWEYIAPKHADGDKREPGYFELKEGAKA